MKGTTKWYESFSKERRGYKKYKGSKLDGIHFEEYNDDIFKDLIYYLMNLTQFSIEKNLKLTLSTFTLIFRLF